MPTQRAPDAKPDGRRQRADGARSRQAILTAATELATVEGLDGLSIARLAEHAGMSKSGLFAHFRSKEDLQVATIDAAAEMFHREVTKPGLAAPAGLRRVRSLCEAFLAYLERAIFPGGCFFVAAAAELDAKPGPVRDHLRMVYSRILEGLAGIIGEAQDLGEIDATEDVAQLTFELDSLMLGANFAYVFFGDPAALDRARLAIEQRLARAAPPAPARRSRPGASRGAKPARQRKRDYLASSPREPHVCLGTYGQVGAARMGKARGFAQSLASTTRLTAMKAADSGGVSGHDSGRPDAAATLGGGSRRARLYLRRR